MAYPYVYLLYGGAKKVSNIKHFKLYTRQKLQPDKNQLLEMTLQQSKAKYRRWLGIIVLFPNA